MSKNKYYKHPKFGIVYGKEMVTPIGRCSWPSLVEPKEAMPAQPGQEQAKPRYEVTILLDKDDKAVAEFELALTIMVDEMLPLFNQGRQATIGLNPDLLKDGDDPKWDKEKYPYYAGKYVLCAKNSEETKVYDAQKKEIPADDIKSGQLIRLVVTPLITSHGLSFKLGVTQLVEDDGVRYAGTMQDPSSFLDVIGEESPSEGEEETTSEPEVAKPIVTSVRPAVTTAPKGALVRAPNPAEARLKMAAATKGKSAALDKL